MDRKTSAPKQSQAFSIIELLVVIAVIAILVGIILPVLAGTRNNARNTATIAEMVAISQASSAFFNDNGRLPGYFSPVEMGSGENGDRGFTTMDNIYLDLAGGVVTSDDGGDSIVEVGPTSETVLVDLDLIGLASAGNSNTGYYNPDGSNISFFNDPEQRAAQGDNLLFPAIVDDFGSPILAWAEDPGVGPADDFAEIDSDSSRARFYWNQNAAFLNATRLGALGENQTDSLTGSLLSPGVNNDAAITKSMAGVLGHPSFPTSSTIDLPNPVPARGRGPIVLHTAGPDGVYYGLDDSKGGGKLAEGASTSGVIEYTVRAGDADIPVDRFDDTLQAVGN